jgi:hypothetical protein
MVAAAMTTTGQQGSACCSPCWVGQAQTFYPTLRGVFAVHSSACGPVITHIITYKQGTPRQSLQLCALHITATCCAAEGRATVQHAWHLVAVTHAAYSQLLSMWTGAALLLAKRQPVQRTQGTEQNNYFRFGKAYVTKATQFVARCCPHHACRHRLDGAHLLMAIRVLRVCSPETSARCQIHTAAS